jgi:peptidoglycan/xylan/chitin deacetylase (PgdA/CDA1 family)
MGVSYSQEGRNSRSETTEWYDRAMSLKRLSLPGWIVAIAAPVFIGTWVVAPQETLSGISVPRTPSLPARLLPDPPPIMRLHHPPREGKVPLPETIYGVNHTWQVALTFDDGPHTVYTKRLLDTLDRHGVKATFFINGYWLDEERRRSAKRAEALVQRAFLSGHTIGNHTYSHAKLIRLSEEAQTREILDNHELITRVTGHAPSLFRPPYAEMTDHMRSVIRKLGYTEALWSATAPDEEIDDPELLCDTVMSWLRTYQGGIVMLHDRYPWSVEAARLILEALDRENHRRTRRGKPTFRVVSLDSFLQPPPQSWALRTGRRQPARCAGSGLR